MSVPSRYKRLKYIQSTGAESINTNITLKDTTIFEIRGAFTELPTDTYACMGYTGNNSTQYLDENQYKQLDYVQTNGTPWIDTGIPISSDLGVEFDMSFDYTDGERIFFGASQETDYSAGYNYAIEVSGKLGVEYCQSYFPQTSTTTTNTFYNIKFNYNGDGKLLVDGNVEFELTEEQRAYPLPTGLNAYIFTRNIANTVTGSYNMIGKYRRIKMYQGTTLVRNFVPVIRLSDDAIGMYDVENSRFYPNQGAAGTLLAPHGEFTICASSTAFYSKFFDGTYTSTIAPDTLVHRFRLDANSRLFYVDNTSMSVAGTNTFKSNINLFDRNTDGVDITTNNPSKFKFYYGTIMEGNTPVADFMPVLDTETEQVGIYDLIRDVFLTSTTGQFIYEEEPDPVPLPNTYTHLKYIEGLGSQYIDTLYPNSYNIMINCVIGDVNGSNDSNTIWGSVDSWANSSTYYRGGGVMRYHLMTQRYYDVAYTANTLFELDYRKNYFKLNDSLCYWNTTSSWADTTNRNIWIWRGGSGNPYSMFKLYSFKIYDDVLVRDFIPVIRNEDSVPGLWDQVNGKFYTNENITAHNFRPGWNEFNPRFYSEADFIESTGSQWINTEINFGHTYSYDIEMMPISGNINDWYPFGHYNANTLMYQNSTSAYAYWAGSGGYALNDRVVNFEKCRVVADNAHMELTTPRGTKTVNYTPSTLSPRNFYLFRANDLSQGYAGSIRFYSTKLYNNNVLVADIRPCLRRHDNVVGMYDFVRNIFLENQGSGVFKLGPFKLRGNHEIIPIDYIQSSNTQFIALNLQGNNNKTRRFVLDYQLTQVGDRQGNGDSSLNIRIPYTVGTTDISYRLGKDIFTQHNQDTKRHLFDFDSYTGALTIDGRLTAYVDNDVAPNSELYLFSTNYTTTTYTYEKIFSFKVYDGSTLIRDMIPAFTKFNYKIGLYDKVEKKFYTNLGNNDFTTVVNYQLEMPLDYGESFTIDKVNNNLTFVADFSTQNIHFSGDEIAKLYEGDLEVDSVCLGDAKII